MPAKGLLQKVVAGPCEPVHICNTEANPVPITGVITGGDITIDGLDVVVSELQLVPNPDGDDQVLTMTAIPSTFVGLGGTLHAATTHVLVRFEMATSRVTYTGTNPIAGFPGLGTPYFSNDHRLLTRATILSMKFIKNQTAPSYIQVSEFYPL